MNKDQIRLDIGRRSYLIRQKSPKSSRILGPDTGATRGMCIHLLSASHLTRVDYYQLLRALLLHMNAILPALDSGLH